MKFIDLSVPLDCNPYGDYPGLIPKVEFITHEQYAQAMATLLLGKDGKVEDLPYGPYGCAGEIIQTSTHSITHMDAPWHYFPTMNNGERAWTIDEIPLDWCYGPGVVLDFSDKPAGYVVKADDIEKALQKINYTIKPGDIVLVRSGAKKWGEPDYLESGCGIGREGTLYLLDRGVKVCGTDAWGWDVPFSYMAKEYEKTKDKSILWEGHLAGIEKAYCHMEKLANLDKIPTSGFTVCCFPISVKGGSAGWVRAVAIINE